LVIGNTQEHTDSSEPSQTIRKTDSDQNIIDNLRFGDGALLKDGTGDDADGRTLKGRYIVRVGWDDVRGWLSEVKNT
jgi:6-phosphofructokinase 1